MEATDGLAVTIVWMVGQTELVKANDSRYMVEVPLAVLPRGWRAEVSSC